MSFCAQSAQDFIQWVAAIRLVMVCTTYMYNSRIAASSMCAYVSECVVSACVSLHECACVCACVCVFVCLSSCPSVSLSLSVCACT